ncbi:uncharacterized protein MONOS_9912 [Monocercomonoides exilis]|uniref:uncharacterized protein n=1 Tax=Monocercomonoides exilis TaxID=2049356 RepID=UPI003559B872|nr:hypothetical protein MONOS_9912 [Monocercomonoides exilis]|eukprot:MONOS_9912.1-p1 / transcript=MONOS_9912.1 / gene=MONOS_9912 / organism=Monocercomonoides_exilis_PA203 / gene_product=unspecified product / transcript_product=unspecified product / location=Mono_scaffold00426:43314-44954(+) / protein_length=425 / sequence_SO=supercontig / SO=protein_coding / is_pseudo=false
MSYQNRSNSYQRSGSSRHGQGLLQTPQRYQSNYRDSRGRGHGTPAGGGSQYRGSTGGFYRRRNDDPLTNGDPMRSWSIGRESWTIGRGRMILGTQKIVYPSNYLHFTTFQDFSDFEAAQRGLTTDSDVVALPPAALVPAAGTDSPPLEASPNFSNSADEIKDQTSDINEDSESDEEKSDEEGENEEKDKKDSTEKDDENEEDEDLQPHKRTLESAKESLKDDKNIDENEDHVIREDGINAFNFKAKSMDNRLREAIRVQNRIFSVLEKQKTTTIIKKDGKEEKKGPTYVDLGRVQMRCIDDRGWKQKINTNEIESLTSVIRRERMEMKNAETERIRQQELRQQLMKQRESGPPHNQPPRVTDIWASNRGRGSNTDRYSRGRDGGSSGGSGSNRQSSYSRDSYQDGGYRRNSERSSSNPSRHSRY